MKRIIMLSGLMVLIAITGAQAKIWRINNTGGGVSCDATTLQAGHDMALSGDTLHLESSPFGYGALVCSKQLVIIGPGYFLAENPETQAYTAVAAVGDLTFNNGSGGTVVTGCWTQSMIYINTSNIKIIRNYLKKIFIGNGPYTFTNIVISQNYCSFSGYWDGAYLTQYSTCTITNLLISNNVIYNTAANTEIFNLNGAVLGIFKNNVIITNSASNGIVMQNFDVKNNIMSSGTFSCTACNIFNNIGSGTQFGTANGNQSNVTMTNVFVGPAGNSTDGQWQLKPGSPAIGAGEGGVDCGIFGTSDPYVLSGLPTVPAIYFYNTYGLGTQQYIQVKVKSHK